MGNLDDQSQMRSDQLISEAWILRLMEGLGDLGLIVRVQQRIPAQVTYVGVQPTGGRSVRRRNTRGQGALVVVGRRDLGNECRFLSL